MGEATAGRRRVEGGDKTPWKGDLRGVGGESGVQHGRLRGHRGGRRHVGGGSPLVRQVGPGRPWEGLTASAEETRGEHGDRDSPDGRPRGHRLPVLAAQGPGPSPSRSLALCSWGQEGVVAAAHAEMPPRLGPAEPSPPSRPSPHLTSWGAPTPQAQMPSLPPERARRAPAPTGHVRRRQREPRTQGALGRQLRSAGGVSVSAGSLGGGTVAPSCTSGLRGGGLGLGLNGNRALEADCTKARGVPAAWREELPDSQLREGRGQKPETGADDLPRPCCPGRRHAALVPLGGRGSAKPHGLSA